MSQTKAQLIDNLVQPITGALGSASAPTFSFTSDPNTGLYSPGADQLALTTGGTGRLFIDSNGRVGIGVAALSQAFTVRAASGGTTARFENTSSGNFIDFQEVTGGTRMGYIGHVNATDMYVHNDKAGPLIFDTNNLERLRITSAGLVGIGTSSPSTILHINTSVNNSSDYYLDAGATALIRNDNASGVTSLKLASSGNSTSALVWGGSGSETLIFANRQNERLRIDSSGRVGIGTTSPSRLLHLSAADSTSFSSADFDQTYNFLRIVNTTNDKAAGIYFGIGTNGEAAITAAETTDGETALVFGTRGGGARSERARLDHAGRLLVGTSSVISNGYGGTAGLLQVAKNDYLPIGFFTYSNTAGETGYCPYVELNRARGTQASPSAVGNGDDLGIINFYGYDSSAFSRAAYIKAVVDGGVSGAGDMPGRLVFATSPDGTVSPVERIRITNDGKALFGGTTSTAAKWNFWDTDSTGMAWLSATTSGNYRRAYLWGSAGSQGLYFTNGNNEANLSSAGAWTNASDARIKKDIEPISYGLAEVMASQPRKYKMIADNQECIGFVAQEMLEIVPEVVSGGETEDRKYCLDYGSLVAVAFKAIQEQQAMIAELQTEMAALKSQ